MAGPRANLSPTQTTTLEALCKAQRPLTAYEVLAALRAWRPNAGPPTAYRALARLEALGLVHRLESMNAYVACCATHHEAPAAFAICDACGNVREIADAKLTDGILSLAAADDFRLEKAVVEMHGRCAGCQRSAS